MGKTALVTGAGCGVGAAIVIALASKDYHVVVADHDHRKAFETCERISELTLGRGIRFGSMVAEIGRPRQMRYALDKAIAKFGRLDVVVLCLSVKDDPAAVLHGVEQTVRFLRGQRSFPGRRFSADRSDRTVDGSVGVVEGGRDERLGRVEEVEEMAIVLVSPVPAPNAPVEELASSIHALAALKTEGIRVNAVCPVAAIKEPSQSRPVQQALMINDVVDCVMHVLHDRSLAGDLIELSAQRMEVLHNCKARL